MTRRLWSPYFFLLSLVVFTLFAFIGAASGNAAPVAQGCEGQIIPGGCFFSQTTNGQVGYSVIDDNQARFWSEYQRLGGSQTVGYPISRRFVYDGFVTQAFQKLVLQWRPEVGVAYPMNVFDELSEAGHDPVLYSTRQTPYPLINFDPPGATWAQVVAGRHALLNANVAIRARYFSVGDPLNVFGLPTSRVEDMGNHYAIRTQRAVFQQWKEAVPWAGAGQVTIANGGDIAKEMGWFDPAWLTPESVPGMPQPTPTPTQDPVWEPLSLVVSAQQPGTLFLLQTNVNDTRYDLRLMVSRNGGASWEPFLDGAVPTTCIEGFTMDYNTPNELYVLGCDGLYHWDGGSWVKESNLTHTGYIIQFGNSQIRWALRDTIDNKREVARTDDGGRTWRQLNLVDSLAWGLGTDPSKHRTLYIMANREPSDYISALARMDSTLEASPIDFIFGDVNVIAAGFTVNGANGDIYFLTGGTRGDPFLTRIWRSRNADEPNVNQIEWQLLYESNFRLEKLVSGTDSSGRFALYVMQENGINRDELLQSLDEGRTWQVVPTPRR